mgnify:CR=1 FL=1
MLTKMTWRILKIFYATKWKFAATILASADYVARTKDLYPVLITSFKCSSDSFAIEYFKQIFDFYKKPYLILQLDEYDSNVGCEMRVEAALRSFNNHFSLDKAASRTQHKEPENKVISHVRGLEGKVLLLPNLGDYSITVFFNSQILFIYLLRSMSLCFLFHHYSADI